MAAFAMALEPGALVCRSCSGFGERAIPEPDGRILPWSRSAICECDGTGRAACGCCGAAGAATHLDDHGFPIGDCCTHTSLCVEAAAIRSALGLEEV